MYYFVEYLRAKGALRIALILLGIILLAVVILRVSVHASNPSDWAYRLQNSPTAHVTRTRLPDGGTRVVIDDPAKRTHAIITDSAGAIHMDVSEPAKSGRAGRDNTSFGHMTMREDVHGGISHVVIDYQRGFAFDLGLLMLATIPMGLMVATILAGPLAKENDGHLELVWTKPISRERYALASIGVDVAAIVISQLLCTAATLLGTLLFIVPRFSYGPHVVFNILVAFLGPIAWYALLTAASSSLKRGPGLVCGMGWLFAIIVPGIAGVLAGVSKYNAIAAGFYAIFHALSYLDPIAYMTFHNAQSTIGTGLGLTIIASAVALAALSIAYIALSVLQWRRVEA